MQLLWLIPAVILLALPLALLIGYNGARVYRSVRDWVRYLRLQRKGKRYLASL